MARRDTVVEGVPVARGEIVVTVLGGANRDPAVFADPDRFDVTRPNAREHVAFSSGIHYCLGAALARMEGEVALRELFTRFPDLAPAGAAVRRPTIILRGCGDAAGPRLASLVRVFPCPDTETHTRELRSKPTHSRLPARANRSVPSWCHERDPCRAAAARRQPGPCPRRRRRADAGRPPLDGPALRGVGRPQRRRRPRRADPGPGVPPGRRRARRDAARHRRLRGAASPAGRHPRGPGAVPHRARRRGGPGRGDLPRAATTT